MSAAFEAARQGFAPVFVEFDTVADTGVVVTLRQFPMYVDTRYQYVPAAGLST